MSDQELRAAERRFAEGPDAPGAAEALLSAYDRAGRLAPAAVLRRAARWQPLVECVKRWYLAPLQDHDGLPEGEVLGTERQLGRPLPQALGEWHVLVGRRLRRVQDRPALLGELRAVEGRVPLWVEGNELWTVEVPLDGDDQAMIVSGEDDPVPLAGLRDALLAMLVSDTLAAATTAGRRGTLGPLRPDVQGGRRKGAGAVMARLRDRYRPFEAPLGPPFYGRHLGDRDTVIRISLFDELRWMTATRSAHERLARLLEG